MHAALLCTFRLQQPHAPYGYMGTMPAHVFRDALLFPLRARLRLLPRVVLHTSSNVHRCVCWRRIQHCHCDRPRGAPCAWRGGPMQPQPRPRRLPQPWRGGPQPRPRPWCRYVVVHEGMCVEGGEEGVRMCAYAHVHARLLSMHAAVHAFVRMYAAVALLAWCIHGCTVGTRIPPHQPLPRKRACRRNARMYVHVHVHIVPHIHRSMRLGCSLSCASVDAACSDGTTCSYAPAKCCMPREWWAGLGWMGARTRVVW